MLDHSQWKKITGRETSYAHTMGMRPDDDDQIWETKHN